MTPRFSLVIPCFNEAASIPELVQRAAFVARAGSGEVVLVDNGSTDDSAHVLDTCTADVEGVRVVHVETNEGYGNGISRGLEVAVAPIVGWTHADLQTDPADVLRALPQLEAGARTFVKGKRFARPLGDRVFTAGMSAFESVLMRSPLRDINAQPTLFSRELLDGWDAAPKDFALDLFAYDLARRRGYRIVRLPVLFGARLHGVSSWNVDLAAKRRFILRTVRYSLELRRSR